MKNVIETLERYYHSFIDQEKSWDFFLGLADYITYILETPVLKDITDREMKKQEDEYKKLEKLEATSLQELGKAKSELLKIITDRNISSDSLRGKWSLLPGVSGGLLNELERFEKGEISVGGFKSDTLEDYLFDIAQSIAEQGYRDAVKEFIVSDQEYNNAGGNIYGNFVFSKSLKLRVVEEKLLERKKQIEIWGALYPLLVAHKAMIDEEKIELDELSKDTKITLQKQNEYVDLLFAVGDVRKMRGINELGESLSRGSLYLLERSTYKSYAQRFHNYLAKELSLEKIAKENAEETTQGISTHKPAIHYQIEAVERILEEDRQKKIDRVLTDYDLQQSQITKKNQNKKKQTKKIRSRYDNGILYFQGKEISFNNKPNQKELLATIFKEPKKNWSYDEIQDKWDEMIKLNAIDRPKNYWKKFYSAGDDINKAIAIKTQIEDFIIKNTKEIKLNPKYV